MLTLELLAAVNVFLSSDSPTRAKLDQLVNDGNVLIGRCEYGLSEYSSGFKYLSAESLAMNAAKPAITQWRNYHDVRIGNMERSVDEYLAFLAPPIDEGVYEDKYRIRIGGTPQCSVRGILLGLLAANLDDKRIDGSEQFKYVTSIIIRNVRDYDYDQYETRTRFRFPYRDYEELDIVYNFVYEVYSLQQLLLQRGMANRYPYPTLILEFRLARISLLIVSMRKIDEATFAPLLWKISATVRNDTHLFARRYYARIAQIAPIVESIEMGLLARESTSELLTKFNTLFSKIEENLANFTDAIRT